MKTKRYSPPYRLVRRNGTRIRLFPYCAFRVLLFPDGIIGLYDHCTEPFYERTVSVPKDVLDWCEGQGIPYRQARSEEWGTIEIKPHSHAQAVAVRVRWFRMTGEGRFLLYHDQLAGKRDGFLSFVDDSGGPFLESVSHVRKDVLDWCDRQGIPYATARDYETGTIELTGYVQIKPDNDAQADALKKRWF